MKKFIMALLVLCTIWTVTFVASHFARRAAQHNEQAYACIRALDCVSFVFDGGGPIGFQNYAKWEYAKWRADPKRTTLEKMLFWDRGIFYDATNPPDEYPYSPLF